MGTKNFDSCELVGAFALHDGLCASWGGGGFFVFLLRALGIRSPPPSPAHQKWLNAEMSVLAIIVG